MQIYWKLKLICIKASLYNLTAVKRIQSKLYFDVFKRMPITRKFGVTLSLWYIYRISMKGYFLLCFQNVLTQQYMCQLIIIYKRLTLIPKGLPKLLEWFKITLTICISTNS